MLFQEGLLLSLDPEIINGKPEGDAEDIKETVGDESIDIVLEFEMVGFFLYPDMPYIGLGLHAEVRDEEQEGDNNEEVEGIFLLSIQPGHQVEGVAIDDEGIGQRGMDGIIKGIFQAVDLQCVDKEHAGEDCPNDPL